MNFEPCDICTLDHDEFAAAIDAILAVNKARADEIVTQEMRDKVASNYSEPLPGGMIGRARF